MIDIGDLFKTRADAYLKLMNDRCLTKNLMLAEGILADAVRCGKAVLICGNGGSAAEAAHMSGEIIGRFKTDRNALPSISLVSDTATITAVSNDFGYDQVFARQVEAYQRFTGAVVFLSTSGNSENLLTAAKKARESGLCTIALLGRDGGLLKALCDVSLVVPSYDTPLIQEAHLSIIHILCEMIEADYHEKGGFS